MIKLLDRYILKKFLTTYVFVVLVLVSVLMVIDYVEKSESFIRNKPPIEALLGDYYLNFIPYWANLLSPITIFIATVFVTSRLAARTEIIAILSSGVSFLRLLVPYTIGSTLVGISIFYLINYVVPVSNKTRIAFELKYDKKPFIFDKQDVHIKIAPKTYVYIANYDNQTHEGYQFTLETIEGNRLFSKFHAQKISWQADVKKWRLTGWTERKFNDSAEVLISGETKDTVINLKPKDFESNYMLYETFTTPQLLDFIEEMKSRGADRIETYMIERYLRITSPFAIIILTLIGVILSARKSRQGTGYQIALGFLLAFIYIMLFVVARSLASAGTLHPLLACWMPNILFAGIGVVLYKTVPR